MMAPLSPEALRWTQAGAPFVVMRPGPHWQPRRAARESDAREETNNG
jgi:hypothetical protein